MDVIRSQSECAVDSLITTAYMHGMKTALVVLIQVNQDPIRFGSNQKHLTPTSTSSVTVVEITFPNSPK